MARLHLLLASACPAGLEVFFAPVDWRPDPHALDLVEGRYATAVQAGGDEVARLRRPFPVDVVPAALVSSPGT